MDRISLRSWFQHSELNPQRISSQRAYLLIMLALLSYVSRSLPLCFGLQTRLMIHIPSPYYYQSTMKSLCNFCSGIHSLLTSKSSSPNFVKSRRRQEGIHLCSHRRHPPRVSPVTTRLSLHSSLATTHDIPLRSSISLLSYPSRSLIWDPLLTV